MSNTHYIISSSYDKYFLNRAEYLDNFLYIYNYLINHDVYLDKKYMTVGLNPTHSSVLDMLVVLDSISALNPGFIQSGFSQPDDIHFKGRLGIFGWCDNRDNPHDIINPLMWYANKKNKPWWDIDLQLDLLMHCDDNVIKRCGTQEFVWGWETINQCGPSEDPTDIRILPKPITFDVFKSGSLVKDGTNKYWYDPLNALICGLFHVSAYFTISAEDADLLSSAKLLLDDRTKNYYSTYVQDYNKNWFFNEVYSLKNLLNITTYVKPVQSVIRGILDDNTSDILLEYCRRMYYFEYSGPVFVQDAYVYTFGSKLVTFNNNEYYVDPVNVSMPYYSIDYDEDGRSAPPTDFIHQNGKITYDEYNHGYYRQVHFDSYPCGGIIVVSMPGDTPPAVFPFKNNYQPWMSKRKNLEKVKRYV